MTDTKVLAVRAVRCKAWKWMRGMSVVSNADLDAIVWHGKEIVYFDANDDVPESHYIKPTDLPDLTDPATLGCLLRLVREHLGDDGACLRRDFRSNGAERWTCEWVPHAPCIAYPLLTIGDTEAECLINALEMEIHND